MIKSIRVCQDGKLIVHVNIIVQALTGLILTSIADHVPDVLTLCNPLFMDARFRFYGSAKTEDTAESHELLRSSTSVRAEKGFVRAPESLVSMRYFCAL